MKKLSLKFLLSSLVSSLVAMLAVANVYALGMPPAEHQPMPPLTKPYIAAPAPVPAAGSASGVYVTAELGAGFLDVNKVRQTLVLTPPIAGATILPLAKTSQNTTAFIGGGAIGYAFPQLPVRAEVQFMYRGDAKFNANPLHAGSLVPDTFRSKVRNYTVMFNSYYDFFRSHTIQPYVMFGVGIANNKARSNYLGLRNSISKTSFAWKAGAGVRLFLTPHIAVGVGYSYNDLGKVNWGRFSFPGASISLHSNHLHSNDVTATITYIF